MKTWSFKKHALFSIITSIIIVSVVYIFQILRVMKLINFAKNETGAIAIIGGADGPTAIYTTASDPLAQFLAKVWLLVPITIVFLLLLLIYKPIKKIIQKGK